MNVIMNVVSQIIFLLLLKANNLEINGSRSENRSSDYVYQSHDFEDIDTLSSTKPSRESHEKISSRNSGYQGDQALCPSRTFCTVLSECRLLLDLMDRTCLIPTRLRELTCGYLKNELMVCCPNGGNSSPFRPGGLGDDDDDGDLDASGQGQDLNQACGRPQLNGWQNGYTGLGSQPWVVRVGFMNKQNDASPTEYSCCGSLITSKVVLTAAHCALAKNSGRAISSVRVGEYDMRTDPDCTNSFCGHPAQNVPVASVVVHPGYEASNYRHDVALIILKTPVNFSLAAQPICLPQSPTIGPLVGKRGTLTGFGRLPDQDVTSPRQHQLQLPIVSNQICSRIYDSVIKINALNHLCVGGEAKKDACSGFGGAPLTLLDPVRQDRFYQVGMVSFGSDKCGAAGVPSVYTNILEYYKWIKANIPK